jgi:hypothetical protein
MASCVAVVAAAVVVLLSTLGAYFLADDFRPHQDLPRQAAALFLTLFFTPWTEGIYGGRPDELRPLVALSYRIDAIWGATNPWGLSPREHRAPRLHCPAGARHRAPPRRIEMGGGDVAGVAFAVMPVNAEVGAWISGRADSIPAVCYLGALLLFGMWRQRTDPLVRVPPS